MSLSRNFILFALLFFRLVFGNNAVDVDNKYENLQTDILLILKIRAYFELQTIFVVNSDDNENLRDTIIAKSMLRRFSSQYFFSITISYTQMPIYENHYNHRIPRPLIAVFLRSHKQFERFQLVTRQYHQLSYPIWLLIFSRDLNESCDQPEFNYFNVRFDTRMLVKCHDDPILREWYHIDGRGMRYVKFAEWTDTKELKVLRKYGLFNTRNNLENTTMRIATVKNASLLTSEKGKFHGYFGLILDELSDALNFTIIQTHQEENYGSLNPVTGQYNGVIGRLQSREVDLGVTEFTMTAERLDVVDFTVPLLVSQNYLYIRKPDKSYLLWSAYFKVYSYYGWLAFQGMFYLSLAIVTTIQVFSKKKPLPASYISENWLSIWGIYCQQSLPEFPTATPSRIAYFSILTTSVILFSIYSACLISYLTFTPPIVMFNDFAEFSRDGSYKLIAAYNSSDYDLFMKSNESLMIKMSKLMQRPEDLPTTMKEGFEQVCKNRVAFYATEAIEIADGDPILCNLVHVPSGTVGSIGMTMTKHNQYKDLINTYLKKFRDHGITMKLRSGIYKRTDKSKNQFAPVPLTGVAMLFILLVAGVALSLTILIVEIVVHKRNSCRIDKKECIRVTNNSRITKR